MSSGVEFLRGLVFSLHEVHGVGGDPLSCVECVVSALNQAHVESIQSVKDRFGNV